MVAVLLVFLIKSVQKGWRKENDQAKRELDPLQGWECSCRWRGCHPQFLPTTTQSIPPVKKKYFYSASSTCPADKNVVDNHSPANLSVLLWKSLYHYGRTEIANIPLFNVLRVLFISLTHISREGWWFEEGCRGYHLVNANRRHSW